MPKKGDFPAASKILDRQWGDKKYQLHRKKVESVRSSLDNQEPQRFPHLDVRLKKIQKNEERQAEVEHENRILLQRMARVMGNRGLDNSNNGYSQYRKSLNGVKRVREQETIAKKNEELFRRLSHMRPKYDPQEWETDFERHATLIERRRLDFEHTQGIIRKDGSKNHSLATSRTSVESERRLPDIKAKRQDTERTFQRQPSKLPRVPQEPPKKKQQTQTQLQLKAKSEPPKARQQTPKPPSRQPSQQQAPSRQASRQASTHVRKQSAPKETKGEKRGVKRPFNLNQDCALAYEFVQEVITATELLQTLLERTHEQRRLVQAKYSEDYAQDAAQVLRSRVDGDLVTVVDALFKDRIQDDVSQISICLQKTATIALLEILVSKNPTQLEQIEQIYVERRGTSIEDDVASDVYEDDLRLLVHALLKTTRSEAAADKSLAEEQANELVKAAEWDVRDCVFLTLLRSESLGQLKAIFLAFEKIAERSLLAAVNEQCSPTYGEAVGTLVKWILDPSSSEAVRLHKMLIGNRSKFIELLVVHAEAMASIQQAYREQFGIDLTENIATTLDENAASLLVWMLEEKSKETRNE